MQLVCHVVVVRAGGGVQTQRGIPTSHRTQQRVQQLQHEPQEKLRGVPLSHRTQERVQQRLEQVVMVE
jgi:hypothetical protein